MFLPRSFVARGLAFLPLLHATVAMGQSPSQTAKQTAPPSAALNASSRIDLPMDQGDQLLADGKFGAAARSYRSALAIHPNDPQIHFHLGLALLGLGDEEGARHEFQRALQLKPDLAPAHNHLGLLAAEAGQSDEEGPIEYNQG